MPFKKYPKKRTFKKKKVYKKAVTWRTGTKAKTVSNINFANIMPTTMICKEIGGWSDRAFVKLRYCTTLQSTFTASQFTYASILANGIINPDGSNPVPGAADWVGLASVGSTNKAPYLSTKVHSAKLRLTAAPSNTASVSTPIAIVVVPMPRGVSAGTYTGGYNGLTGLPGCSAQKVLNSGVSSNSITTECAVRIRDVMGMNKEQYASANDASGYIGNYNTNPAITSYFVVGLNALTYTGTLGTFTVDAQIEVEYLVEFFARNMPTLAAPS